MKTESTAAARLAASWLLAYPDDALFAQLERIDAVATELDHDVRASIAAFRSYLATTPRIDVQQHFVNVFDMRRKACPYLTYWTDGDTRNRGEAILRFKQAYLDAGYELGNAELPDHLAVVLEFAAVGDRVTGEALLASHQEAIHLLRDALAKLSSAYVHVLDAVVATLPTPTPEVRARMAQIAASGPPAETVGLAAYGTSLTLEPIGARR